MCGRTGGVEFCVHGVVDYMVAVAEGGEGVEGGPEAVL